MNRSKVSNKDLSIISENLCALYESGIPFLTIFELMEELKISKSYKTTLSKIRSTISSGGTLHYGFKEFRELYPEFFIAMINIGERTGRLSDVLKALQLYYNKLCDIQKSLMSAITYPAILAISSFFMMSFLLINVVPTFGEIYVAMNKEIPILCKNVIKISNFIRNNFLYTTLLCICWGVLIPIFLYKYLFKDVLNNLFYSLPIITKITEYISIMLLSVIFKSGVSLSLGLEFCSFSNLFNNINSKFERLNNEILSGKSLSESMNSLGIFSKYTIVHIRLGEESGTTDMRLFKIEDELFKRIILEMNNMVKVIGPFLIIFIGIVILLFILIFILPLFDAMMTGGIN